MPTLAPHAIERHALFVALLALGCGGSKEPCWELAQNDRLSVEIIEPYTADSQYTFAPPVAIPEGTPSCGADFDFWTGDTLELTLVEKFDTEQLDCMPHRARLDTPSSGRATITEEASQSTGLGYGPTPVNVLGRAVVDECHGFWRSDLLETSSGQNLFAAPEPGQVPPVLMVRMLGPFGSPACEAVFGTPPPRNCADMFVVKLGKL